MKQSKTSEQIKTAYIGAAALIIAAIIGGIFALANNHPTPTPTPSPFSSPTPTSSTSLTSIPPTNTPVPMPTQTPQVILTNQTMSCTNCTPDGNLSLNIKNATIDRAQSQVTLLIGVKNNSTSDLSGVQFKYLKLQDTQTGVTTDGGGDGFSSFYILVNQQILFRPTFQFVPIAGHEYYLSAELDYNTFFSALFSPITITF